MSEPETFLVDGRLAAERHYRLGPRGVISELEGMTDLQSRSERVMALMCLGRLQEAAAESDLIGEDARVDPRVRSTSLQLEVALGRRKAAEASATISALAEGLPEKSSLVLRLAAVTLMTEASTRRSERLGFNATRVELAHKIVELGPENRHAWASLISGQLLAGDNWPAMDSANTLDRLGPGACPRNWAAIRAAAHRVGDRDFEGIARSKVRELQGRRTARRWISASLTRYPLFFYVAAMIAAMIAPVTGHPVWLALSIALSGAPAIPYLISPVRSRYRRRALIYAAVLSTIAVLMWVISLRS